MPPKYTPETISFLVADVARMLRNEFDRRITSLDLTPAEARMLANVARSGPVRQSVLAERISVEAMTLSVCLDRLESQGLVERMPDPSDRRAKLVDITEAAEPVLDEIFAASTAMQADITAGADAAGVKEFRRILLAIHANLVAMRPDCNKGNATQ